MLRIGGQVRVHTDDQVDEIIGRAVEIALRENVPAELREAVFVQAAGLLANKHVAVEQVGAAVVNGPHGLRV